MLLLRKLKSWDFATAAGEVDRIIGREFKPSQKTVSKSELVAEVWHAESVSNSSISTAIAALRQTLGDDAENPRFIKTVRQRGYASKGAKWRRIRAKPTPNSRIFPKRVGSAPAASISSR